MALKSLSILLFLTLLVQISFVHSDASSGRKAAVTGGWKPIENLKEPEVQDIAKFAITEHNTKAKASLVLQSVDKGETKVVAGTDYRLLLTAKNGSMHPGRYMAVVWVKPWLHYRNLTTFEILLD